MNALQIYAGDDTVEYAFMGADPTAADNRWLRDAMEQQVPVIYFLGVSPGFRSRLAPRAAARRTHIRSDCWCVGSGAGVVSALRSQGWLPCDGSAYSAQDYSELARVIGNSFGNLRVPDLRGRFLRGTDQGTKRDPDAGSRRAENGGNSGDKVGSL